MGPTSALGIGKFLSTFTSLSKLFESWQLKGHQSSLSHRFPVFYIAGHQIIACSSIASSFSFNLDRTLKRFCLNASTTFYCRSCQPQPSKYRLLSFSFNPFIVSRSTKLEFPINVGLGGVGYGSRSETPIIAAEASEKATCKEIETLLQN
jgi:hypothetical protein